MVTLVVYENENKNIGARPLMLPLQQADICTATQKRNLRMAAITLAIYWVYVFLLEEELVSEVVL